MHRKFFQLLLLLLPTQFGIHFWPEWAGVLGRRVDYLAPTLYLTDIVLFSTLIFWFISEILNIKFQISNLHIKNQIGKSNIFVIPVVLLFVVANVFFAQNHYIAIYKWLKVCEFVLLGWYIVKTKPALSMIIAPLSIGVLYSSVLAIGQFILQHSVGGPLWWLGERTFDTDTPGIARASMCQWVSGSSGGCPELLRPYGTFPHPNVLGGYLAALVPLVIIQLSNNPIIKLSNIKKIFYLMTIVFGGVALLLTFSRSAVAVGTGAMLWALLNIKYQISNIKSIFVILVFVLLFLLITHYSSLITLNEESVVVRGHLNGAAIKLWQSSPFLGVGLGNFLVRLPEALTTRTIYFLQPVHNIYLLLLSEVGVVGIGIIVISLWILRRQETRDRRQGVNDRSQETGNRRQELLKFEHVSCLVSLVTLLVLGLIDHYPLTLQQGQLLLTILTGLNLQNVRDVRKVRNVREVKK